MQKKQAFIFQNILVSLGLAFVILWCVCQHQGIQKRCFASLMDQLEHAIKIPISCANYFIDPLTGRAILRDVSASFVSGKDANVHVDKLTLRLCIVRSLVNRQITLAISLDGVKIDAGSTEQEKEKILQFVQGISAPQKSGAICVRTVRVENAHIVSGSIFPQPVAVDFDGILMLQCSKTALEKLQVQVRHGSVSVDDVTVICNASGAGAWLSKKKKQTFLTLDVTTFLTPESFKLRGMSDGCETVLRLDQGDVMRAKVVINEKVGSFCASISAQKLVESLLCKMPHWLSSQLVSSQFMGSPLLNSSLLSCKTMPDYVVTGIFDRSCGADRHVNATVQCSRSDQRHKMLQANIEIDPLCVKSTYTLVPLMGQLYEGQAQYDKKTALFSADVHTVNAVKIKNSVVKKGAAFLKYDQKQIQVQVQLDDVQVDVDAVVGPQEISPHIVRCEYRHNDRALTFSTEGAHDYKLRGHVPYATLIGFLPYDVQHVLVGSKGIFDVAIDQQNWRHITGQFTLKDAQLNPLGSINLITGGACRFGIDIDQRKIVVDKAFVQLFKGSVDIEHAAVSWDRSGSISTINVPLVVKNMLINVRRNFYALADAQLLFQRTLGNDQSFTGTINLAKSFLKGSLQDDADDMAGMSPCISLLEEKNRSTHFAIDLICAQPMNMVTDVVKTKLLPSLRVEGAYCRGAFHQPSLKGHVNLDGGSISLLGRDLHIARGRIDVVPHRLQDPFIDLLAHGFIKRYAITVHATGPLSAPHIVLESNPQLTREQIFSLFFGGGEAGQLREYFPGMIMKNLHTLLISSKGKEHPGVLKRMTKFFEYVQLVPYQGERSGARGVKATMHFDIAPHVRALFEKDLIRDEDFSFQLEYDVTDELNLKLLSQAQGDLGAQLEMCMRF